MNTEHYYHPHHCKHLNLDNSKKKIKQRSNSVKSFKEFLSLLFIHLFYKVINLIELYLAANESDDTMLWAVIVAIIAMLMFIYLACGFCIMCKTIKEMQKDEALAIKVSIPK